MKKFKEQCSRQIFLFIVGGKLYTEEFIRKNESGLMNQCKKIEDDILELRREVAERFQKEIEAARADPNKEGMTKEEIAELCGVAIEDIEGLRRINR